MAHRWYVGFVMAFWLVAMSWLTVEKVLPPLVGGRAPDYRTVLEDAPREPPPVVWRIVWEDEQAKTHEIGHAATGIRPLAGGGAELRSLVAFEDLDVKRILRQLLGVLAAMASSLGDEEFHLQLTVATRLEFDAEKSLQRLDTSFALGGEKHVLNLHGEMRDGRTLDVMAFSGRRLPRTGDNGDSLPLRHQLDLPRNALVGDAFAPHSELKNLEVGQTWTIPVYRPFPPNSAVEIIEAKAERLELISWNQETVEVMVVAYRSDAGSGLGAARKPIGRVWVRPDGRVLQQEVVVSNLRLLFERLPDDQGAKHAARLEDAEFLPYLPTADSPEPETPSA